MVTDLSIQARGEDVVSMNYFDASNSCRVSANIHITQLIHMLIPRGFAVLITIPPNYQTLNQE